MRGNICQIIRSLTKKDDLFHFQLEFFIYIKNTLKIHWFHQASQEDCYLFLLVSQQTSSEPLP